MVRGTEVSWPEGGSTEVESENIRGETERQQKFNRKNPRDLVSRLNLSVILGKSLKLSGHSFCHMTISCLMEVTSKNLATLTF